MINPNGASDPGCGAFAVPELQDLKANKAIPLSEWGLQSGSQMERFT